MINCIVVHIESCYVFHMAHSIVELSDLRVHIVAYLFLVGHGHKMWFIYWNIIDD